jgi:hypothetical protein
MAFSPQANYTVWATATDYRILVPTVADRGVSRGQRGGTPTTVNLNCLDWSRYFFFPVAPHMCLLGWVDRVPDPLLLRKFFSPGNRTQGPWASSRELWPLDHRDGPKNAIIYINWICSCVTRYNIIIIMIHVWDCVRLKRPPLPVIVSKVP